LFLLFTFVYLYNYLKLYFKDYGVFTTMDRKAEEFLLEYDGDFITEKEGTLREKKYKIQEKGCYQYYFEHGKKQLW
jgi:hypothetical protein